MANYRAYVPNAPWQCMPPPNMVYPFIPPFRLPVPQFQQVPSRHTFPDPSAGLQVRGSVKTKMVAEASVQTDPIEIQPSVHVQKNVETVDSDTQTSLNDLLKAQKLLKNSNLPLNGSLELEKFFQQGTKENNMYRTVLRHQLSLVEDYEALPDNSVLMDITIDKVSSN